MNNFQKYKPAKNISEQIQYLNEKKESNIIIWIKIQRVTNY